MMKLRYAKTSPFVRKVLVFADEVGMADRIELAPTDVWTAETDIARDNPLGKVPALVTREGTFVGSFACCDYLERRNGAPKLIPDEPKARWRVMQIHGLADGMMEAAVDYIIEVLRRPQEYVYAGYLDRQMAKIVGALDALEARLDDLSPVDLGSITTACALGYLDLRFADKLDWRARTPGLAAWYAEFAKRPSMQKTRPDV
ncbi:MAG: glutathione S-transferase family protein [Hyphomicrobiales bacterium]|nr:glutathione S-transferase family protein [Hyphomicrobiales bacterium]